jgi:hypothetical protein
MRRKGAIKVVNVSEFASEAERLENEARRASAPSLRRIFEIQAKFYRSVIENDNIGASSRRRPRRNIAKSK